jgi:hypothetical protein
MLTVRTWTASCGRLAWIQAVVLCVSAVMAMSIIQTQEIANVSFSTLHSLEFNLLHMHDMCLTVYGSKARAAVHPSI